MQMLLTEEEYVELMSIKKKFDGVDKVKLQELCTIACNKIPVIWRPEQVPEPWGCILNYDGNGCGYCDECPVEDYCPYEHKEWSK